MTEFQKITETDRLFFAKIVGKNHIFFDENTISEYSQDATSERDFRAELVIFPQNTTEISQILAFCNQKRIPVTTRGAGTGLSGGALPVMGGVVLSVKRLNKILEIDERNLQVVTEPAVVTEFLQNELRARGLFYPPDPASRGSSWIGGNVATGAGGPKAVKYGVVKDFVLDLEVVLASGEVIRTGARTLKNSTGYNLTQLFVGSEGTLGVITKIFLKVLPHPEFDLLMLASFENMSRASAAVSAVFRAGIVPSALEFMEKEALSRAVEYVGGSPFPFDEAAEAHLLIEVDGMNPEVLREDCMKIAEILENFEVGDILFADSDGQKSELWRIRRCVGLAVKKCGIFIEEDTVVPRAELPELMEFIKKTARKYGFTTVSFGHAGDGNIHVNILKENISDENWHEKVPIGIEEIFRKVKSLGGTISGEHGVGLVQKQWLPIVFSQTEINLRKSIKNAFDERGILNPGKLF